MDDEDRYFSTCVAGDRIKVALINPAVEDLANGETALVISLTKRGAIALVKDVLEEVAELEGIPEFDKPSSTT
jgi:hypothetical protein